ncbi:D-aminoacyl-tRNA deacylase [Thalassobacter stenotrophicus]|uniref:D-aminoacyl-tRNA deacylase n=2 Tax=Thalassobacter stenotrophicus TaxID=266809 RepID=A0A0P1EYR2_9RHOB|nr:D-aminoacyl-tRNA deacylase [Thalassobacter stenotrophicus]PVZ47524.1 D-tyrosyl-tRNA(Tyr) deacylase [Thalassobacter stenotrophicus]CUH60312.1 D-tyrosyl-tRNA(Tyr) deacylase [Thalassobacter stenotrophicus]SHI72484.1 D-tyrosyl-tRNA(Tyr) deacylase [Thalassobacter stenotrophicus DSM 16310]
MRAVVQRVRHAQVHVDGALIGECGHGVMILVCAMQGDTTDNANALVDKIAKLRIFKDDAGKMNRSLLDAEGSALVISQFTLAADTSRGNRPGFSAAAAPDEGEKLYEYFAARLAAQGVPTQTGQFGADMAVSLVNDGPVTIQIER